MRVFAMTLSARRNDQSEKLILIMIIVRIRGHMIGASMNELPPPSSSTFASSAPSRFAPLQLAAQRTPESASRIAAGLHLAVDRGWRTWALHDCSIPSAATGSEQATDLERHDAAVTACARMLRRPGQGPRGPGTVERCFPTDRCTRAGPGRSWSSTTARSRGGRRRRTRARRLRDAAGRGWRRRRRRRRPVSSPDVVLADVHMPDSTPAELCARLRAAAGCSRASVCCSRGCRMKSSRSSRRQPPPTASSRRIAGSHAVVDEITQRVPERRRVTTDNERLRAVATRWRDTRGPRSGARERAPTPCSCSASGHACSGPRHDHVYEVVVSGSITPVPTARPYVLGITLVRGRLVPVISLGELLGYSGQRRSSAHAASPADPARRFARDRSHVGRDARTLRRSM